MQSFEGRLRSFFGRHARKAVALFFLAILLLGLCTNNYGRTWDDLSEMNILRMSLKEYAALLPIKSATSDWLMSSDLPRISESVERDHGICAYYPLFWVVCRDDLTPRQTTCLWRSYTWALFTLGLFALYACARHMGLSRLMSCLGVLLLLSSPRFFAEGHYNNKDIPLMVFVLTLLWQAARLMEKPSLGRGLCFALVAGLCAGTRIIGIAFCGLFGLMVVLHLLKTQRLNRRAIGVGCATLLSAITVYVLLTPGFLAGPIAFWEYTLKNAVGFSRWHGTVLYWGTPYDCAVTKPPRLYLPTLIAVTTPLWMLMLLAVGSVSAVRKACKACLALVSDAPSFLLVTSLLSWLSPLLMAVAVRMLAYNGWRHLYFIYGPMVLCMLRGLQALKQRLHTTLWFRRFGVPALATCMITGAIGLMTNHPFQYGYFNPLVPTQNRAALFELDSWNVSCVTALEALLEQTEGEVHIVADDLSTRSGLALASHYLDDERLVVVETVGARGEADYLLSNLSYAAISGSVPDETMTPVVTLRSFGADMTVIYALEEGKKP